MRSLECKIYFAKAFGVQNLFCEGLWSTKFILRRKAKCTLFNRKTLYISRHSTRYKRFIKQQIELMTMVKNSFIPVIRCTSLNTIQHKRCPIRFAIPSFNKLTFGCRQGFNLSDSHFQFAEKAEDKVCCHFIGYRP